MVIAHKGDRMKDRFRRAGAVAIVGGIMLRVLPVLILLREMKAVGRSNLHIMDVGIDRLSSFAMVAAVMSEIGGYAIMSGLFMLILSYMNEVPHETMSETDALIEEIKRKRDSMPPEPKSEEERDLEWEKFMGRRK